MDFRAEAANLLGALALLAGGAVHEAVAATVGAGGVLGEALVAIKDQPGRTADWLAQVLHISQPGSAHLVRKLTGQGWVHRADQGRARPLRLTGAGERAADAALAARATVLERLVDRLSAERHRRVAGRVVQALRPGRLSTLPRPRGQATCHLNARPSTLGLQPHCRV